MPGTASGMWDLTLKENSLGPNSFPFTRVDRKYAAAFYRVLEIGISLIRGNPAPQPTLS